MNKKIILSFLLVLTAMTGQAQTIPQDWFKTDTITIRGRIENFDAEKFGFTTMTCYDMDVLEHEEEVIILNIAADGTFETKFQANYPVFNEFFNFRGFKQSSNNC